MKNNSQSKNKKSQGHIVIQVLYQSTEELKNRVGTMENQ
jgi:hypothetical protein